MPRPVWKFLHLSPVHGAKTFASTFTGLGRRENCLASLKYLPAFAETVFASSSPVQWFLFTAQLHCTIATGGAI